MKKGFGSFAGMALMIAAPLSSFAQPWAPEPPPMPESPQVQTRIIRTTNTNGSFLGVGLQEVDSERAKALKLKQEEGVEITRIEDDSPAQKAGLKVGDVILQYNGQHVEGFEQFSRFVRETPPGRDVRMLVSRDGNTQTVTAKIAGRKAGAMMPLAALPRIEMPAVPEMPRAFMMWHSSMLGVEGESLRGQLADFFGVKEGVLVRSVSKDTAAEKAGLKAGDVILKVNDVKVASPSDISAALRSLKGKTSVPILLMRDKKESTVNATIEPDKSGFEPGSPAIHISNGAGVRM